MSDCPICSEPRKKYKTLFRKTCGNVDCVNALIRKNVKGKNGGVREGSGRSKAGYYKGIYCGSTYELVWVIYRLDHNLPVQRFKGFIPYKNTKYFPDFLVDEKIVEIKGYHTCLVDDKTQAAKDAGYEIDVLYQTDLDKEFEWVKVNYNTTVFESLFDNYKAKFIYTCKSCNKEFDSEKKKRTEVVYCSRICAGRGHEGSGNITGKNQYSK